MADESVLKGHEGRQQEASSPSALCDLGSVLNADREG